MLEQEIRKRESIPDSHSLTQTRSAWAGAKKGLDTDIRYFTQRDEEGNFVAEYEVKDSTETYPPFRDFIDIKKVK